MSLDGVNCHCYCYSNLFSTALQINNDPGNPLTIETLPTKDPIELFGLWFKEASECKDISETSKFMTLATASRYRSHKSTPALK